MSILKKEEYMQRLQERLGTDSSDESIQFLEDMTDTYNDLERQALGDGEDWEKKYHELDASWKKRYQHRFFSGGENNPNGYFSPVEDEEDEITADNIGIKDLFQ